MKLLRKDVLKWIRALQSGAYKKGKDKLVSNNGTKFCCLGVWADMQGCTWAESLDCLVPVPKGKHAPSAAQERSGSFLKDPKIARGLDIQVQKVLAIINDESQRGFKPVIAYIKKEILPQAE